ncbi:unnamed protein product [Brassicogethes aeneus]|uniref:3-hydroxyisobutyryl-CoA hydrolase, mitochondrial n=1 Tax=Brassicogethes aeneus TaxID=1431903 RepID=A0A9P0FJ74_BRAAE|nr:unnamed protein product [Brassicogethes aeneus]
MCVYLNYCNRINNLLIKKVNITPLFNKKLLQNIFSVSARNMSDSQEDVLIQNVDDKGIICLNRPKALNSLNLSMVRKIYPTLAKWEKEKTLVIVKGAGDKAFCAGGDVKAVVESAFEGGDLGNQFFREEYICNGLIGSYKIPYIAFIHGIVMGGGVGLSVHGKYRVATEKTLFAMPETQIGLFPDVGGTYFLPRLGGQLGYYLALTGFRLKGSDVMKAGIATHFVQSDDLHNLEQELLQCKNENDVQYTLKKFHVKDLPEFSLTKDLDKINYTFASDTVEGIVQKLENDCSEWGQQTLKLMQKMSPTSLKVSLKALEIGKKMDLLDCLQMEYRLATSCLANKDFLEGVRALLIDKDQNPQWSPKKIEDVTNDIVHSFFTKLPDHQELKHRL